MGLRWPSMKCDRIPVRRISISIRSSKIDEKTSTAKNLSNNSFKKLKQLFLGQCGTRYTMFKVYSHRIFGLLCQLKQPIYGQRNPTIFLQLVVLALHGAQLYLQPRIASHYQNSISRLRFFLHLAEILTKVSEAFCEKSAWMIFQI